MRAFARQDLATCVSICNVLMTTLTPHETNMSINYTHCNRISHQRYYEVEWCCTPSNPTECYSHVDQVGEDCPKVSAAGLEEGYVHRTVLQSLS